MSIGDHFSIHFKSRHLFQFEESSASPLEQAILATAEAPGESGQFKEPLTDPDYSAQAKRTGEIEPVIVGVNPTPAI